MEASVLWDTVLSAVRPHIRAQEIEVWLRRSRLLDVGDDVILLEVENAYYRDWIQDRYQKHLVEAASGILGRPVGVEYQFRDGPAESVPPADDVSAEPDPFAPTRGLETAQTFGNFVVGECNKFAHAAAMAVSDSLAEQYNPLFIYGATGLGKTHLMHAIGNRIIARDTSARVVYVTSEEFMNEMIRGLRYKRMEEFRNKYRKSSSVLLVDDIQFLSGKDRTQEEFFHTFNALQSSGRQVVLTSDVVPKNIAKLEERLRTRFEGGLLADLQAPDMETLRAIMWQKADTFGVELPDDLAVALANHVAGNIRELEGVLKKLAALHAFHGKPLTVDFARKHMPDLFTENLATVTVPNIIEAVARYHNIRSADIIGKRRTRQLTEPRHIAMYLARQLTRNSFPELGREFGDRDHSTVQHGVKKIGEKLENNPDLAYKIQLIQQSLKVRPQ
jgi:chromosomal replication initiator protein